MFYRGVLGRSVAFLTFNEPVLKRQSLDSSQTSECFKAGVDLETEAKERVEPAGAGDTEGVSRPSPGNEDKDAVCVNPFDVDSDDDSSFDLFDENGLGAQTSLRCNFEEGEGEDEEEDSGASQNEAASGATAGNSKNAPPMARHPNDAAEGSNSNSNRPSEPTARKLFGVRAEVEPEAQAQAQPQAQAGEEEPAGNKGYGFGFAHKGGDGGAAADDGFGNLGATAALTPESVGPVPFALESTAPRSRVGSSSSEPPSSPAPESSLPNSARVERKVSRIAGLLRRLSSRDRGMSDPADALQLKPLEVDSDNQYGA